VALLAIHGTPSPAWEVLAFLRRQEDRDLAIVTDKLNALVRRLHDRMPVIIDPAEFDVWLTVWADEAQALLQPCPSDHVKAHPLSSRINTPANDADCIAPMAATAPLTTCACRRQDPAPL
jgi:putative SOS response-associated peptidase YedK